MASLSRFCYEEGPVPAQELAGVPLAGQDHVAVPAPVPGGRGLDRALAPGRGALAVPTCICGKNTIPYVSWIHCCFARSVASL